MMTRALDLFGGGEIMPQADCETLLRQSQVGRVGVVVDDQVDIFPVNYTVDSGRILFRTNAGRKLDATRYGEATFEIDDIDVKARAGWSVVVHGYVEDITDEPQPHLTPIPWTGPKDRLLRVTPRDITGRRVKQADQYLMPE